MSYVSRVVGTGMGFPERVMTNSEFESFLDTSDEWITTRTGIKTRRIANLEKGETTSAFAATAAMEALKAANLSATDLDLIVMGTISPDMPMPCTANLLQARIGATKAFSFDLSAACSGWIYGMSIADHFIRAGTVKHALVVGAETLSSFLNWKDRTTCVLFGDGAGATVLSRSEDPNHKVMSIKLYSDGTKGDILCVPHGYAKVPPSVAEYKPALHKVVMDGQEVFKNAVRSMMDCSQALMAENGLTSENVDFFIFHQANIRIVDMCTKALGVPREKTWVNVDKYGNTSSATLPVAFHEAVAAGKIKSGDTVLLTTFGGGVTWGSALIKF